MIKNMILTRNFVVPIFQGKEKIQKFVHGNFKCLKETDFLKHFVRYLQK